MVRTNRGMLIASTLMLVAIITSGCNQAYSQAPAATFTPVSQSLFASAVPTNMSSVEVFATGTALAQQQTTTPGAGLPGATTVVGITPQQGVTVTATPLVVVNSTATATLAVAQTQVQPSGPTATTIPAGSKPASYTLQQGEFVYCIARRFNVDPDEVLSLNGLSDSQTIYPGLTIKIPQTGNSFPGNRTLSAHPTTYTVSSTGETVFSVACAFGDVDPAAIAQANNISVNSALSAGQTLSIP
jgi:LysM repeat protein